MFSKFVEKTPKRECMQRNSAWEGYFKKSKFQWENKNNKALFRGAINGDLYDVNNATFISHEEG
jgi:hypothetical protein